MKKILIASCFLLFCFININSQTIVSFKVSAGIYERNNSPVCIIIDQLTSLPDSMLYLEEISKNGSKRVPCQIENGYSRKLWWIISGITKAGESRTYELKQGNTPAEKPVINANIKDGSLLLSQNNNSIMQYNYKTTYPPAGVDTAYRRNAYIHPLWSPKGTVLTTIQPTDHYHHYGIWNPWTKTSFEGKEIDFWNLKLRQGRIAFDGFVSTTSGTVYGGFKVHHAHIVYPDSSARKTALNELWDVRVFNIGTSAWLWDFTSTISCASESPLTIKEYRYQGLGFRANQEWNKDNASMLSSEGKTRKDADGTRARWCIVQGQSARGKSGIVFMGNPANYNYPEPIRIWDETQNNGRGDVFFNFCPTKNKNWSLIPGKEYTLRYRMLVFDDSSTKEQAEAAWIDFAYPPVVTVEQIKK